MEQKKKEKKLMDNSGVIAGRGVVEVEEGKGGNKR